MSYYFAKFKENPCVGTDVHTPLKFSMKLGESILCIAVGKVNFQSTCLVNKDAKS